MNIEHLLSIVPKSTIIKYKLDTIDKIKDHVYSHPSIYGLKSEDYPSYYLMNKDEIVAEIITDTGLEGLTYELVNIRGVMPYNCPSIQTWFKSRKAATSRSHLLDVMKWYCASYEALINLTYCTNLIDTFWVKEQSSDLTWEQVSLYRNNFNEDISDIVEKAINKEFEIKDYKCQLIKR